MSHCYEVPHYDGENFPVSIAFATLEEAIEFANTNDLYFIAEIGGNWAEYDRCEICGEWFDTDETHLGVCYKCDR